MKGFRIVAVRVEYPVMNILLPILRVQLHAVIIFLAAGLTPAQAPVFRAAPVVDLPHPAGFDTIDGLVHVDAATGAAVFASALDSGPFLIWLRLRARIVHNRSARVEVSDRGNLAVYDDDIGGRPVRAWQWVEGLADGWTGIATAVVPRGVAGSMSARIESALRGMRPAKDLGLISSLPPPGWQVTRRPRDLVLQRGDETVSVRRPSNPIGPVALFGDRDTTLMWTTGPKGFGGLFQPVEIFGERRLQVAGKNAYAMAFRNPRYNEDLVQMIALVFDRNVLSDTVFAYIRGFAPLDQRDRVIPGWHTLLKSVRFRENAGTDAVVRRVRSAVLVHHALSGRLPEAIHDLSSSLTFSGLPAIRYQKSGERSFALEHPGDPTSRITSTITRIRRRRL